MVVVLLLLLVAEWKVENREGKGGEPVEGRGQRVLFPSMFPSQLCNEGRMHEGRADQARGSVSSRGGITDRWLGTGRTKA